mgnify:FL=1
MPIANHDKAVETAEALLDSIMEGIEHFRRPEHLHQLAQAFKLVVEASPKVSERRRSGVAH